MTLILILLASWLAISPMLLWRLRRAAPRQATPSIAEVALLWGWYGLIFAAIFAAAGDHTWGLGIWAPRISPVILFGGLGLMAAAIGELIELGTLLRPVEALDELTWGGVYRYSRHPLYLGTMIAAGGVALAGHSGLALAICGLFAIAFPVWAPVWERDLERRLGASYTSYRERTPVLIGRPKD